MALGMTFRRIRGRIVPIAKKAGKQLTAGKRTDALKKKALSGIGKPGKLKSRRKAFQKAIKTRAAGKARFAASVRAQRPQTAIEYGILGGAAGLAGLAVSEKVRPRKLKTRVAGKKR